MSRDDERQPQPALSLDERMARLDRELRAPLEEIARVAAQLGAADASSASALYNGRFGELIEILGIASAKLAEVAASLPALRSRGAASGGLTEDDVHRFRHDMLTPVGTVRGVAGMLAAAHVRDTHGVPAEFAARAQRLAAPLNEIKDLLDALTDTRGRG